MKKIKHTKIPNEIANILLHALGDLQTGLEDQMSVTIPEQRRYAARLFKKSEKARDWIYDNLRKDFKVKSV